MRKNAWAHAVIGGNRPDDATFAGDTTAIEAGKDLWLGSYRGNRIAIVPEP